MQIVLQHENIDTFVNNLSERVYWQLAWRLGTYSGTWHLYEYLENEDLGTNDYIELHVCSSHQHEQA